MPGSDTAEPAPPWVAEAMRLCEAGDLAAAERVCRGVLGQSPRDPAALALLGAVLLAGQRYGEADETFGELTGSEPREPSHWINLGTARRGLGKLDDALGAYGKATALGEKSVNLYFNLGVTHLDRGDFAAARAVLEQARAVAPRD